MKSGVLVTSLGQSHLSAKQEHWAITSTRYRRVGVESGGPPPTGVSLFLACCSRHDTHHKAGLLCAEDHDPQA